VTVDVNGNFTYDHTGVAAFQDLAVGESIVDFFNYTISDGNGAQDTAMVTITVDGVNGVPVAANDTYTVAEDSGITQLDVLVNDIDPDASDILTVTIVTQPANGNVEIVLGSSFVTYEPDADFNGADTFTYTVSDGNGATNLATVTMMVTGVNDAPVITTSTAPDGLQGEAYTLNVDATDVDGDSLTYTLGTDMTDLSISPSGVIHGTPTTPGTFYLLAEVDDGNGGTDDVNLTLTIDSDQDGDGIPDSTDTDRDGDGVDNSDDEFPDDATETIDTDNDGTGDNADTDDDGDGVLDSEDAFPLDGDESADADGDGIGDNADPDDDNDGIPDDEEGAETGDFISDYWWIILIIIIAVIVALALLFIGGTKGSSKVEDEMQEYADAEEEAAIEEADDVVQDETTSDEPETKEEPETAKDEPAEVEEPEA
jgi:hypothetical protein